ncbi:unnamed protein product, partial [Gulo gulo]
GVAWPFVDALILQHWVGAAAWRAEAQWAGGSGSFAGLGGSITQSKWSPSSVQPESLRRRGLTECLGPWAQPVPQGAAFRLW